MTDECEHGCTVHLFQNAQKLGKEYPDTFDAPDLADLYAHVEVNDYVKVCSHDERYWTQVAHIEDEIIYARVANDLISAQFKPNDVVHFEYDNIYEHNKEGWGDEALDPDEPEPRENIRGVHDTCN